MACAGITLPVPPCASSFPSTKYELDGGDPIGFAVVARCFGKHDGPWREGPIFGKVRYTDASGLRSNFDADRYATVWLAKPEVWHVRTCAGTPGHPQEEEADMKEKDLAGLLRDMFASQKVAVLATSAEGQPYGSLVAFAVTGNLGQLLFATARSTRKYTNLLGDPRVTLVVDNRGELRSGLSNALAITAVGKAEELRGGEKEQMVEVYTSRHSYLSDFVGSRDIALFAVNVDYYVISSFAQGVRLEMPLK